MPRRPHRRRRRLLLAAATAAALAGTGLTLLPSDDASAATARQAEKLDRGLVSVHTDAGNLVSWRWLGTDPDNVAFNVYRAGTKVNSATITGSTNFFHDGAPSSADYTVRAVVNGTEQPDSAHAIQLRSGYTDVPITPPAGGTTPDGVAYTNTALRIYSTPVQTSTRITTLLHDTQYRTALAWQNTAYNQPPHPSFFIGDKMPTAPRPTITTP